MIVERYGALCKLLSVLVASSYVSGCGLQVPRMGEFYETPTDAGLRLNIIESQSDAK